MFRRLFWFAAGLSTGVWATLKVNRAVRRLTPEGLAATAADRATELGARAKRFALDVRTGMTEREAELGQALGIEPAGAPEALPARHHPQIAAPGATRRTHRTSRPQTPVQPYEQTYKKKEGH